MIRPLVSLLHTDRDGKQNYEALRGLTNLAGFSEKLRYDFSHLQATFEGSIVSYYGVLAQQAVQQAVLTLCFHLCCRVKIVKDNALPDIENYMFEQHDQLRQAATECMCNLVTCKEVRMNSPC